MTPDDYLLLAGVNWRGDPATFDRGALTTSGEYFNEAWGAAPWNGLDPDAKIAFEYFAGLVFNADYEGIDGLQRVVDSWMLTPLTHVPWTIFLPLEFPWTPDHIPYRVPMSEGMAGRGGISPLYYVKHPLIDHAYFSSDIRYGPYRSFHLSGGKGVEVYRLAEWLTEEEGPSFEKTHQNPLFPRFPSYIKAADRGTSWPLGFTFSIMDMCLSYIQTEKSLERGYSPAFDTAETRNGFIFNNWAEEKFGPPFVTSVP